MRLPALGMGTWHMGEDPSRRRAEVDALRLGLDLGVGLIDTAEMYGDGGAEEVVCEAVRGRRDEVFVVSKFYPHNASPARLRAACAGSLRRLGIERIDLYLYHWPGSHPLADTVEALERLREAGAIRHWGVSNFDVAQIAEVAALPGGAEVATDQVLYNLARRGIEFDLLPWCAARDIAVMAYSPFDEGPLVRHPALRTLAAAAGITPSQLALAWVMREPGVCAIPKAVRPEHVRANAAARDIRLDAATLRALDASFQPPTRKRPLEII